MRNIPFQIWLIFLCFSANWTNKFHSQGKNSYNWKRTNSIWHVSMTRSFFQLRKSNEKIFIFLAVGNCGTCVDHSRYSFGKFICCWKRAERWRSFPFINIQPIKAFPLSSLDFYFHFSLFSLTRDSRGLKNLTLDGKSNRV